MHRITIHVGLALFLATCSPREDPQPTTGREPSTLSDAPYPSQHADERRSDFVEALAPESVAKQWEALTDSMIAQPCTTGPDNHVYCTRAWAPEHGRCNLVALDGSDGAILWTDKVDETCLLDELAWISAALVDAEGNVYAADSRRLVSFTADGSLRWSREIFADLPSERDFPNVPFGLNMGPAGQLVMATMGDAWILVVDPSSGDLLHPPFDLPSAKSELQSPVPDAFMAELASPWAAQVLWEISAGGSPYEVDNDVAVDPHSGLVFVAAGGPTPNAENIGALWALRIAEEGVSTAFHVLLTEGEGGSGTTPTVTADGQFVLVGDNAGNLVVIDIPACLAAAEGAGCSEFLLFPIGTGLGASFTVTPENRLLIASSKLHAFQLSREEGGGIVVERLWTSDVNPLVVTGFENLAYFPTLDGRLMAVDIRSGEIAFEAPSGFAANVSMASDRSTLITNNINYGRPPPAGVWGWRSE